MAGPEQTFRLFLLGAGFSKPAGLPLAKDLVPLVRQVANQYLSVENGYNHVSHAMDDYEAYLGDTEPSRPFDLEEFGAWLNWTHVLRLRGSDTFSEHGNEADLQLRWAIGKVLFDTTPRDLPAVYIEFAKRLNTSDRVLTLNYDLLVERALQEVGLPFRRFPARFSEIHEVYAVGDQDEPDELVLVKLHGSLDWTYLSGRPDDATLGLRPLVEGPRPEDDPLRQVAVIPTESLDLYYSSQRSWWASPTLIMHPSTAKPMAASPLVPLWDGVGLYSYMLGGFAVIGCSLPPGDPYVLQLVHHIATDYPPKQNDRGLPWPQRKMKLIDYRRGRIATNELRQRYRFMDPDFTDVLLDGFSIESLPRLFDED